MRLSHARMYERLLASDATCDGHFFTGVLTTGIYCLPSCRARKPKSENVRFFPSCEAARAAGLRPCRKCHPDDFARGADPVLADIEALVGEVRARPAAFADARAIVRRSGFGATRLFELCKQHFHTTPAELLVRARVEVAKRALVSPPASAAGAGTPDLVQVALDAGFESQSAFHQNFRRLTGLTPAAYRDLRDATAFEIALPAGYPLAYLRRALSRDPHSMSERLAGDTYATAVRLGPRGEPAVLQLTLAASHVRAAIIAGSGDVAREAVHAHAIVVGLLGLDQDAAAFAKLAARLGLARLTAGREELRLSQTTSVFDGLLWSIIGQQINFPFACLLKRRLFERCGERIAFRAADGTPAELIAPPTPAAVAALDPAGLIPLQFSRQKAAYVVGTARLVASGELDLEALRTMSATRAERTLLAVRGLGPWSINYLLMRALGFADCVPLGDTGVTSGLLALLELDERPDIEATRRLMAVFSPYRSLATAHLWQFTQPVPPPAAP